MSILVLLLTFVEVVIKIFSHRSLRTNMLIEESLYGVSAKLVA